MQSVELAIINESASCLTVQKDASHPLSLRHLHPHSQPYLQARFLLRHPHLITLHALQLTHQLSCVLVDKHIQTLQQVQDEYHSFQVDEVINTIEPIESALQTLILAKCYPKVTCDNIVLTTAHQIKFVEGVFLGNPHQQHSSQQAVYRDLCTVTLQLMKKQTDSQYQQMNLLKKQIPKAKRKLFIKIIRKAYPKQKKIKKSKANKKLVTRRKESRQVFKLVGKNEEISQSILEARQKKRNKENSFPIS